MIFSSSAATTAVDISSSASVPPLQGSNGSSIGSGIGGDESSSVSSVDDYLLDNDTSSSGYTQEEQDELAHIITEDDLNELLLDSILGRDSSRPKNQYQSRSNDKQTTATTTFDNEEWIEGIIQAMQAARDEEQKTTAANECTTNSTNTNKKETSNGKIFLMQK